MCVVKGAAAIDKLQAEHPEAHKFFGSHVSDEYFIAVFSQSNWTVYECNNCWIMVDAKNPFVHEIHWFCPDGAKLPALRAILSQHFTETGVRAVWGRQPVGHPNARPARILAVALGASAHVDGYLLTRKRFRRYNAGKPGME